MEFRSVEYPKISSLYKRGFVVMDGRTLRYGYNWVSSNTSMRNTSYDYFFLGVF